MFPHLPLATVVAWILAAGKLLYSNVNLRDVTQMAPFAYDEAGGTGTLAIASEDCLLVRSRTDTTTLPCLVQCSPSAACADKRLIVCTVHSLLHALGLPPALR